MLTWKSVSDEIFLQAVRNHCLQVVGSVPDEPQTELQKHTVISRSKEFHEKYPDWIEGLEKEIAKLTDS